MKRIWLPEHNCLGSEIVCCGTINVTVLAAMILEQLSMSVSPQPASIQCICKMIHRRSDLTNCNGFEGARSITLWVGKLVQTQQMHRSVVYSSEWLRHCGRRRAARTEGNCTSANSSRAGSRSCLLLLLCVAPAAFCAARIYTALISRAAGANSLVSSHDRSPRWCTYSDTT